MATLSTLPSTSLKPHREWNSLEILTRSRAGLLGLTALLLAAIVFATQTHRGAMTLVGKDTAPSIIDAQTIKTKLAAMDANAVDELLNPGATLSGGQFEDRRLEVSDALIAAAQHAAPESEKKPLRTLESVMGTYERLVQEARDLQDAGQQEMAVRYYRAAAIVMDGTLLPAADALDKASNDLLEQEYESRSTHSLIMRLLVVAVGLVVLGALVMAQLYLSRHTRRTLNPGLAGATLLAFALLVFAFTALEREQSSLRDAKKDAFDSVHALLQARAVAYSGNSDESRVLLDPKHAGEYLTAFDQKSALLAHTATPEERRYLVTQLRGGEKVPYFTGFFADELNNITYVGEREAAIDTVVQYEQYLVLDRQLRALESSGHSDQAIILDVGTQPGQSDWAFTQFDQALVRVLEINVNEFNHAVDNGLSAVANLEWITGVSGLLIAALIFFGFAPRIREYQ